MIGAGAVVPPGTGQGLSAHLAVGISIGKPLSPHPSVQVDAEHSNSRARLSATRTRTLKTPTGRIPAVTNLRTRVAVKALTQPTRKATRV
eukprot:SAG31_NODE_26294_length_444_cov_33.278261_1_plen_89_part_10